MQPRILFLQAVLAVTTLLGIVLLGHAVIALAFAGVLLAVALVLASAFHVARRAYAHSAERVYEVPARALELAIAAAWALTAAVPAGLAIAVLALDWSPVHFAYPLAADIAFGALSAATVVMLASSLVDWYYVVPRLSGRVCLPPCMDEGGERWRTVTQVWWGHRWVATACVIGGILAFLVATSWTALYALSLGLLEGQTTAAGDNAETIAALIGAGVTAAGSVLLRISGLIRTIAGDYVDALRPSASRGLSPDFVVGEYVNVLRSPGDAVEGYVLEIALEGVAIVPRDLIDGTQPRKPLRAETVRSAALASATVKPASGPYCAGSACQYMNERHCLCAKQLRASTATDAAAAQR